MKTPNEFWLCLHRLAEAYDAEGLTPTERADNIIGEILSMPPTVRQQSLNDLRLVAINVPDLFPIVAAAVSSAEESQRPQHAYHSA
jgi:hypothetical protein